MPRTAAVPQSWTWPAAAAAQADARPRERLDGALLLVGLVALAALVAVAYSGARFEDRAGLFDPPIAQPVVDERILTGFRDSPAPIVDATMLDGGRGEAIVARSDGTLHRLDPFTGVFRDEKIPDHLGLTGKVAQISSGCGGLAGSAPPPPCPAGDDLFVLGAGGRLVTRSGTDRWRVLLDDAAWEGRQGRLVTQDDVVTWGATEDGRWVLVLAGAQGAALFDQRDLRWLLVEGDEPVVRMGGAETRLVVAGTTFWLANAGGLGRIRAGDEPALEWSSDTELTVRDLAVSGNGEVLAVIEGPCDEGNHEGCLSLRRVAAPDAMDVLVGEEEINPELADDTTHHAALQAGKVVTLGDGGINVYVPERRAWETLASGKVDAFHAVENEEQLYAAVGGQVLQIANGEIIDIWNLHGAPFSQVHAVDDDTVLVLDRAGAIRNAVSGAVLAPARWGRPRRRSLCDGSQRRPDACSRRPGRCAGA